MITLENYIQVKQLDLDLTKMRSSCDTLYDLIVKEFGSNEVSYNGQSTLSTGLFSSYNLLMYSLPEFHKLYREIGSAFHELNDQPYDFYIQCWLNYYRKGDFINWHRHWLPEQESWHGFYCVNCEPSSTTYKLRGGKIVNVESKNNKLVISKSDGDVHRTWPWEYDEPRITIAFDIVPAQHIPYNQWLNHWVPI